MTDLAGFVASAAQQYLPSAIELRRYLHRHPEAPFREFRTQQTVRDYLGALGVGTRTHDLGASAVATITGAAGGAEVDVALRAGIDGVLVQEENPLPYASAEPGVSHAAGRDAAIAATLTTAVALLAYRNYWSGRVTLLFQSASEAPPGTAAQIAATGVLPGSAAVYGTQFDPSQSTGQVRVGAGAGHPVVDRFAIDVRGLGAHSSRPHEGRDAALAASNLVTALHTVVARRVPPGTGAVLTVSRIESAAVVDSVPDRARIEGTVQLERPAVRTAVATAIDDLVSGIPVGYGCRASFDYAPGLPAVVGDEATADHALRTLSAVLPEGTVRRGLPPADDRDDFGYLLERNAGSMLAIGSAGASAATREPLYSPRFELDETALATLVAAQLGLVLMDPRRRR